MLYTLTNVQKKQVAKLGLSVVECNATGVDGTNIEVTIWEKDKNGAMFPNFAALAEGSKVEANPYQNPSTGKWTLYPPRVVGTAAPKRSPAAITKAMEVKADNIKHAQENRAEGVKISATMRDAVAIVVSMNAKGTMNAFQIEQEITKWREWLWHQWDAPENYAPFANAAKPVAPAVSPKTAPESVETPIDDAEAQYEAMAREIPI
jgi:hypothetical protein